MSFLPISFDRSLRMSGPEVEIYERKILRKKKKLKIKEKKKKTRPRPSFRDLLFYKFPPLVHINVREGGFTFTLVTDKCFF